jgi:hypothetical protein
MRRNLVVPAHPERICWGCDKYCSADDLACGNGTIRTPHPCELFGDDWLEWSHSRQEAADDRAKRNDRRSGGASHGSSWQA